MGQNVCHRLSKLHSSFKALLRGCGFARLPWLSLSTHLGGKDGDCVFSLFVFWGKHGQGTEQVPGEGRLHMLLLGFLLCISYFLPFVVLSSQNLAGSLLLNPSALAACQNHLGSFEKILMPKLTPNEIRTSEVRWGAEDGAPGWSPRPARTLMCPSGETAAGRSPRALHRVSFSPSATPNSRVGSAQSRTAFFF